MSQNTPLTPLHFNAFVMNTTSHIHHGQWRRPDAEQTEFADVNTWVELAKLLEDAKFDAMFFADVVGHYGDADADYSVYVNEGLQIPSNDPTVLLGALAVVTKNIGLATTSNIFQSHPYQFARQISTLDHISNGRIAWNIVTGTQDNGSRNFGIPRLTEHAERYRWAEEYVDVTYKLWEGSWDDGAVSKDRANSQYSDPAKVHKIYHEGERYSVEGPHLPSPSPQRSPVIFQAGSSESGREFAARNAEAVFIIAGSPELAQLQIEDTRKRAVAHGRAPEDIKFFQGLSFVIGDSEEEAQRKLAKYEENASVEGYLAHMALVDPDGRVYPADTPLKDLKTNTQRGFSEWVSKAITDREPVIADIAWQSHRNNRIVGTPEQIADELVRWQEAGVDGINVINWVIPGSFQEFADKVLPVLRERGLAQTDYAPGTLRQKLFGRDQLADTHPAARYRGAFAAQPARV
ncbi:MAG: LLM class flavin-dependent oxidoreductase [Yaniella sp.]|uniref:LLM class flavin-dependent oxidoreductase n=1 Tax=Yaniella sp. TaxID=2773929 RepID=UPI00264A3E84|nr:LLM class flavin-dependent oxidoreductase [Yaniella sp.]MDN5731923.1 LLM class flavin-dependent oxidoreductase [Yaniella sp.]MDN5819069.1 LLM class flavin-dependent oxidoreductase [Yaniella sp.]MDN5839366.1 LLM class flavin-dependent oxidoreductase [Yaniella sp.]MDN5889875.1 LLM class flavin-dependent oxidoreductase [Yaniella sp.]MDN6456474.1 LLM class flavin-dependent oxidoreductase [Yaniella sp.]